MQLFVLIVRLLLVISHVFVLLLFVVALRLILHPFVFLFITLHLAPPSTGRDDRVLHATAKDSVPSFVTSK